MSALGVIGKACTTAREMRAGPVGLQEQAPNHLKLRWLRARVVSVKDKSRHKIAAGMVRETNASEPLMRCRNTIDDVKTGG